jgi:hypothetical protein
MTTPIFAQITFPTKNARLRWEEKHPKEPTMHPYKKEK